MSATKWGRQQEHFDWMQKCLTCWKVCEEFVTWSVENGQYVSSINACRDATEMCSQCIRFEAQRSPFFQQLCGVCADICERFVGELRKFESENEVIAETIDSCTAFIKACRDIGEKSSSDADIKSNFIPGQGDRK